MVASLDQLARTMVRVRFQILRSVGYDRSAQPMNERQDWGTAVFGVTALILAMIGATGASMHPAAPIQRDRLTASDPDPYDDFGHAVSVDGDTVVVGADLDYNTGIRTGSAYVFVRNERSWTEQAVLTNHGDGQDFFGGAVALDADTLIVGAEAAGSQNGLPGTGAAYVFVRSGNSWTQQAKISAPDGAFQDAFGRSVDIDGDTGIVGAWRADSPLGAGTGAAYVFVRSGVRWTLQQKLTAPNGASADYFGIVSLDSATAVVGAREHTTSVAQSAGAAYVFVRSGSTWIWQAELIASDGAPNDDSGDT
jgi:hypothetical protein